MSVTFEVRQDARIRRSSASGWMLIDTIDNANSYHVSGSISFRVVVRRTVL